MLRGKFGQIGSEFRDGHITMDAFEQAAFRDHIRSGERIMYLASMGQLKHKKTRNTIAAEPTPRSSCPSRADAATGAHAPGAATSGLGTGGHSSSNDANRKSHPVPQGVDKAAGVGRVPAARNPDAKQVESGRGKGHHKDGSDPRSHPHPSSSPVYREEADPDQDDASKPPPARGPRVRVASSTRPNPGSGRPHSAGPVGRRPPSPSVGTVRHATRGDATVNGTPAENVPRHVGPEIVAPPADAAGACGAHGEGPIAARRRPSSAGGARAEEEKWQTAQQSPTRIVHRGFGGQVLGGGGGGGGGRNGRDVRRESEGMVRSASKARVPRDQPTARTAGGSFAESVIKSARPFAYYDYAGTPAKARPKSAGAAAPAFDPGSHEAHALALETRFMPVGAIHKAFKGRRLAAVQAWDPHAAAAVRAARAEELLRRKLVGRTRAAGATLAAAASDRRRPRAATGGEECRSRDAALRHPGDREGRQQTGPSWARRPGGKAYGKASGQAGKEKGGEAVDWSGANTSEKDCCRKDPARWKLAPTASHDGAGDSCHGSGSEPDKHERAPCSSRSSTATGSDYCRRSMIDSARGSASEGGATSSTARASTAMGHSPRWSGKTSGCATSRRSASTSHNYGSSTSRSNEIAAEERRARLLAELETLRKRMADAEGLLREVDSSLQPRRRKRPGTARSRATTDFSGHHSRGTGASLAATPGNTSAKSSAGYGAFNLGERRMCPVVVTHPANAFPGEL